MTLMNGSVLLDSNVIIDVFRGKAEVIDRVRNISHIYIPVIVLGELYFGANKSEQTSKRIAEIEYLRQSSSVVMVSEATAQIYGLIKNELRIKGKPIPENDIWIAAITKEHNFTLLTGDNHFDEVEGIHVEKL